MALSSTIGGAQLQDSVFDLGKLGNLKRQVTSDGSSKADQKEVAKQFEALFLQMMLKRMRQATPKDGLFDSQQTQMLQSMQDEQLALQLATPGIGLADALLRQMQMNQPPSDADTSTDAVDRVKRDQYGQLQPTRPDGEVSALLDVLRTNRARDRAVAAAEGAPDHVVSFVSRMANAANAAAAESGVPARLILGQAALESGWGKREIKHADGSTSYNLFGIKAGANWKGKVVNVLTTEYVGGVPQKVTQPFRAYDSYEESFADYARLVGSSPRYESVAQARNEVEAARRIQDSGYATDPRYADKLINIMTQLGSTVAKVDFSGNP